MKSTIKLSNENDKNTIVTMSELKSCQLGEIVESIHRNYIGRIVMRSPNDSFVMNLSTVGENRGWSEPFGEIKVRILESSEIVTLTLQND